MRIMPVGRVSGWLAPPVHLIRKGIRRLEASLQMRSVGLAVVLTLVVVVVFSFVSMILVKSSLLDQVSSQSRIDFSNHVIQSQRVLDSTDVSASFQYQHSINGLASTLQRDGPTNLVGVYIWSHSASINQLIPVSTDPTHISLISDQMRDGAGSARDGDVLYQAVSLNGANGKTEPGAVLGTILHFSAVGDLELFFLYSYQTYQASLTQIQANLMGGCLVLSIFIGLLVRAVVKHIVRPIKKVASVAQVLAWGGLDTRVLVDRVDEIGTLQRSFNTMAENLTQKIDELETAGVSQRRFVSDVSHELRTPVTTMRMACDLLEKRKMSFDASTQRTVELLSGQIRRFENLLVDLLEISRYDSGHAALDLAESDVGEVVDSALGQMQPIASAKNITINFHEPESRIIAKVDPRRILRIVRNLLSNAVDFADNNPIDLALAQNEKALIIAVCDHGIGMGPDQLTHLFDRFWRGDPSRSRLTGGSGLGLSISVVDAHLHHGGIEAFSKPGEGSLMLVFLPNDPDNGAVRCNELPLNQLDVAMLRALSMWNRSS